MSHHHDHHHHHHHEHQGNGHHDHSISQNQGQCHPTLSVSIPEHDEKQVGLGIGPMKIPPSLYQKNRTKLFEQFDHVDRSQFESIGKAALFFKGGDQQHAYDTDAEILFRQESFFFYVFGLNEPGAFGVLDLKIRESLLFVPRPYEEYELWAGKVQPLSAYKETYGVDHVFFCDEMASVLTQRGIRVLHVIAGKNSDSKSFFATPNFEELAKTYPGMNQFTVDSTLLYWPLVECRVRKTPEEIEVMRYVNAISSAAHIEVMRKVRPGMYEYQLEAIFRGQCGIMGGIRYVAYTCICCTGKSGSVLHYGHAGAPLAKKIQPNDMLLLDMGGDYHGYCADITCSFPASGKFTEEHRQIYEAVYEAQQAVINAMKPGVLWPDMHRLAECIILQHLLKNSFINPRGKTIEQLRDLFIAAVFMPHGLGHFLGYDVHDVGGYPSGVNRIDEPGIRKLRTARVLEEGMILTVEPGLYFIDANIDRAAADPSIKDYLNMEKINQFRNFGGVRLEDDVLVTATGAENLTRCPRRIEDIERIMAEGRAQSN
jgi:Xaa-Pro dipeptidase